MTTPMVEISKQTHAALRTPLNSGTLLPKLMRGEVRVKPMLRTE